MTSCSGGGHLEAQGAVVELDPPVDGRTGHRGCPPGHGERVEQIVGRLADGGDGLQEGAGRHGSSAPRPSGRGDPRSGPPWAGSWLRHWRARAPRPRTKSTTDQPEDEMSAGLRASGPGAGRAWCARPRKGAVATVPWPFRRAVTTVVAAPPGRGVGGAGEVVSGIGLRPPVGVSCTGRSSCALLWLGQCVKGVALARFRARQECYLCGPPRPVGPRGPAVTPQSETTSDEFCADGSRVVRPMVSQALEAWNGPGGERHRLGRRWRRVWGVTPPHLLGASDGRRRREMNSARRPRPPAIAPSGAQVGGPDDADVGPQPKWSSGTVAVQPRCHERRSH